MSNGTVPGNLSTNHLMVALAPEQTKDSKVELANHYNKVFTQVEDKLNIAELLGDRIRDLVVVEQPLNLRDLVLKARKRLREDRLQADVDELRARRFVLSTVITKLQID